MKAPTGPCRLGGRDRRLCRRISQIPTPIPVDGRGVTYSLAFFSAKHLGAGQFYLMTIVDKDGPAFRRRQHLSPHCAAQRACQAVLVGDRL